MADVELSAMKVKLGLLSAYDLDPIAAYRSKAYRRQERDTCSKKRGPVLLSLPRISLKACVSQRIK